MAAVVNNIVSSDNSILEALTRIVSGLEGNRAEERVFGSPEIVPDMLNVDMSDMAEYRAKKRKSKLVIDLDRIKDVEVNIGTSQETDPIAKSDDEKLFFQKDSCPYKDLLNIDSDIYKNPTFDKDKEVCINLYNTIFNAYYGKLSIIVVGCGGTGSRVINLLAQFAATSKEFSIDITLCDFDEISIKNLSRQLFYEFEVGENKAIALANRYELLYGINIKAHTNKIASSALSNCPFAISGYPIVFDCTDNVQARKDLTRFFDKYCHNSYALISSGNEKDFGQVVVGIKHNFEIISTDIELSQNQALRNLFNCVRGCNSKHVYLPSLIDYFPNMVDSGTVSCGEMEIAEEQSIAINSTMAQVMFNNFFALINKRGNLKSAIVYGNLENEYSSEKVNTKEKLLRHYAKTIYGRHLSEEKLKACVNVLYSCSVFMRLAGSILNPTNTHNSHINSLLMEKELSSVYYSKNNKYLESLDLFVKENLNREDAWMLYPFIFTVVNFFTGKCVENRTLFNYYLSPIYYAKNIENSGREIMENLIAFYIDIQKNNKGLMYFGDVNANI